MSEYIHKCHNKSLLLYHFVSPIKYRRKVLSDAVSETLKKIFFQIEERYQIHFLEIGLDRGLIHFMIRSVPRKATKKIIEAINEFPETYDLNNYNCSDFGIEIGNKAGLNLPATIGEYGVRPFYFKGRNPADLGEDIREISPSGGITIDKNGGNAPKKKGKC